MGGKQVLPKFYTGTDYDIIDVGIRYITNRFQTIVDHHLELDRCVL